MYLIGIDGGGTHTRMELRDGDNRFLRRASFGPFNPAAIGETAFRQRLREIFADVGDMRDAASICIGGAGSSGGVMETILREELTAAGFAGIVFLCGDHEIALAGAMESAGCILIAGTGSICCGRNTDGAFVRCGGWGHLLDDCGSAYAIGRAALSATLRTEDGRLAPNKLHSAVMAQLGAQDARDIVRFAYYEASGKAEIAALAPLVLRCAQAGDTVSRELLEEQSGELLRMVRAVIGQLALQRPKIALLGGLLEADNVYSAMVRDAVGSIADITPPAHDALWGAAQLAYEQHTSVR